MGNIPDELEELLTEDYVAMFSVVSPDGLPEATPTWVDYDGTYVLINSVEGRRKVEHVRQNPGVAVCIVDPENTSRYLSISGDVVDITKDGAVQHVHQLANQYRGVSEYPYLDRDPGDRVLIKIEPHHVFQNSLERESTDSGFSRSQS